MKTQKEQQEAALKVLDRSETSQKAEDEIPNSAIDPQNIDLEMVPYKQAGFADEAINLRK